MTALHRWAWRQDENFVTEAFAHLLCHLRDHEPDAFVGLLNYLTGPEPKHRLDRPETAKITTQVTKDEGRPDMEIRSGDHLVYVEVKVESGLGWRQLKRYRTALGKDDAGSRTLVLLTRYHVEEDASGTKPHVTRRWYGVAEQLRERLARDTWAHPQSAFLVRQFTDFLQDRGMTMERVTSELGNGVRALWNLIQMLEEALEGHKAIYRQSVGQEWSGYYVRDKKGWAGVMWERPTDLVLQSNELAVDDDAAEHVGYGAVEPYRWGPGGKAWYHRLVLDSEEVHFFARSRASQIQCIEEFVKKGLEGLAKLEEGGQQ